MSRLPRSHPRYGSLVTRAGLAEAARSGLVVPEGLIAHGRGEAFDYFLGEVSTPSARRAERAAAAWLWAARHPVVSVNGNVAALAAREIAALASAHPALRVEVNLFHRSPGRARAVAARLRACGVREVLGVRPSARIAGLASDRSLVDARGIALADVCLVPLEDGDRTEALRRAGKRVITIDLNPLSRTSTAADLPIVDELTRALRAITRALADRSDARGSGSFRAFDAEGALRDARATMARNLTRAVGAPRAARPGGARPPRGSGRRRRRRR